MLFSLWGAGSSSLGKSSTKKKKESTEKIINDQLREILCFLFPLTVLFLSLSECSLSLNVGLLQDYGFDIVFGLFSFKGFFQCTDTNYMCFFLCLNGNKLSSKNILPTAEHGDWKDTACTDNVIIDVNYLTHGFCCGRHEFQGEFLFAFFLFFFERTAIFSAFKMSFRSQRDVYKHGKV